MTQKSLATELIGLTLYKKQTWNPDGVLNNSGFLLKSASTLLEDRVITIDYKDHRVYLDGKQMRLPKKLSKDLITIVQLKIAKIIKHNVSRH
jgi:hypothetical protein